MSYVSIVSFQTMVMFLLMVIGYTCFRTGLVDTSGSKQISNVAIYVANPALLVNAFSTKMPAGIGAKALVSIGLIAVVYTVSILLVHLRFKPGQRLDQFAVIFANVGFVGLPLAKNVLGNESVFYMSLFVGISNFVIWTYGQYLVAGSSANTSLVKILLNPSVLALFIGLFLMLTKVHFPSIINVVIADLSDMNLPLVMIALGCYLAEGDVLAALKSRQLYITCFWRLLVIPLVLLLLFKPLPNAMNMVRLTILLGSCTPVAALMAIFSKEYGGNYLYSTAVVGISTLASLVTIPVMLFLAQIFW